MLAYHFTGDKLRDGSPIPKIGEELRFEGNIVICESGLHASKHVRDALEYAPGPNLHLVDCREVKDEQEDKFVCASRTIIKTIDATNILREFSRWNALQVVHLWGAPSVVIEYLKTGREDLRDAAWAVWADAAEAARAAAAEAARAAAEAAQNAAWAARAAARAAAWAAAAEAAQNAEWAARDAAWAAADAAARAAAWADAARAAARAKQRKKFASLVNNAFKEI